MAGEKEIRAKIASVKNMQKITGAMEKVAASKIRKAQAQMEASRPYAERIRRVIGHLAHANPDYKHPYLTEREVKRVGFILISTDRGLCGGLNINMFKRVIREISKWQEESVEVDLVLVATALAPTPFTSRWGATCLCNHCAVLPPRAAFVRWASRAGRFRKSRPIFCWSRMSRCAV